ncbi:uncharacterized protein LOC133185288 [Saccostrea echinata]|uniref:uncharacterized protein LOC133185288 n=1 Tax=Saccostrea echinata TaxID=191078 RepID=UPI002A825C49|nr:uncharacterized protein LOC133185288 [Saccostrea echinata]
MLLFQIQLVFCALCITQSQGRNIILTGDDATKNLENFAFDFKFRIGSNIVSVNEPFSSMKFSNPEPSSLPVIKYKKDGDWILVFKAQSLTGISPFEIYKSEGVRHEFWGSFPERCTDLAKVSGCFTPYRTGLIDSWEKLDIQQVRFLVIINSEIKREIIFDGKNSTSTDWFSSRRILSSSWTDLTATQTYNLFSLQGIQDGRVNRHWSISHNFGGCPNDRAWFTTSFYPPTGCAFDKRESAMPNFVVCPGTTMCNMQRESINADAFAIQIKAKNKLPMI